VLFVRNIDALGWELHLRDPESSGNQTEYLYHGDSFLQVCKEGELDIVKAMVERTQVELEARDEDGATPLPPLPISASRVCTQLIPHIGLRLFLHKFALLYTTVSPPYISHCLCHCHSSW